MHNLAAVEARLETLGFASAFLEDLSPGQQIDLFRAADIIVAQHGAGLANLLFCVPGTRVIELMPAAEMRPFFWQISQKLGLVHAMLFCDSGSDDRGFNAPMQVDLDRLDRLYRLMAG
jgi:capsular polysaccharide biosynthesis protein